MIHRVLIDCIKALMGITALASIYIGCFLYPDEENRLHNRIEQFWISIDERRRVSQSLTLARNVGRLINRLLNRILGPELFSVRMIAVTICYSLSSLRMWEVFLYHRSLTHAPILIPGVLIRSLLAEGVTVAAMLLAGGLIASINARAWATATALVAVGYGLWSEKLPFMYHFFGFDIDLSGVLALSICADLLCLASVRWTIRWLIHEPSVKSFLAGIALQFGILVFFLALPWKIGIAEDFASWSSSGLIVSYQVSGSFILLSLNTSTGVFSLSFLAVLVFITAHSLIWPVLSRATLPLARFGIIRNHKLMVAIGVALLGLISPAASFLLEKIAKLF